MRKFLRLFAVVAVLAMVTAACAGDEDGGEATGPTAEGGLPGEGLPRVLCERHRRVDDRSFNQEIHEGMLRAETELGIEYTFVESQSEADYAPFLASPGTRTVTSMSGRIQLRSRHRGVGRGEPGQLYAIVDYDIFDF